MEEVVNLTRVVSVGWWRQNLDTSGLKREKEVKDWRQKAEFMLLISLFIERKMGELLEGDMDVKLREFFF